TTRRRRDKRNWFWQLFRFLMPERAGEYVTKLSGLRRAAAPGHDLVGAYQGEIGFVEIAQRPGQIDDRKLGAERGCRLARLARVRRVIAKLQQRPFESEPIVQGRTILQPGMRRAPSGACGRHVDIRGIRRRPAAVGDNDGRAVVASTEGDAGNVELGAGMLVEIDA